MSSVALRGALVVALVLAHGIAHAQDRVLVATTAKVIAAGAGLKLGATCSIKVTTDADGPGCFRACAARVTCGKRQFDLDHATCEAPGSFDSDAICQAAFDKQVFTTVGSSGTLDIADGLAVIGEGDDGAILRFIGGRQRLGDPEGKPTARLKASMKVITIDGPVPVKARSCSVELAVYADPQTPAACRHRCVAKLACGELRQSGQGECRVPDAYRRAGKCAAPLEALTFHDDHDDLAITIVGSGRGTTSASVPLFRSGRVTLER